MKSKNRLGNNKLFDPKMGLAGALFLGVIVFFINYDHGITNGLIAASKQALYTFFVGGFITRLCENIATIKKSLSAIFLAVFIPSILAVSLTYFVHSIKGTPEPFNSTIPTILLAPPGFLWWALQKRKQIHLTDKSN